MPASLITNVDWPLSSLTIWMRASGTTSVPSARCHVIVGFGMAENFTVNFAVSVNRHVTSAGLPSTFGFTRIATRSRYDHRSAHCLCIRTTHVHICLRFNAFLSIVGHHLVDSDLRHVGLADRQRTRGPFRVDTSLLIRLDLRIVEVPANRAISCRSSVVSFLPCQPRLRYTFAVYGQDTSGTLDDIQIVELSGELQWCRDFDGRRRIDLSHFVLHR